MLIKNNAKSFIKLHILNKGSWGKRRHLVLAHYIFPVLPELRFFFLKMFMKFINVAICIKSIFMKNKRLRSKIFMMVWFWDLNCGTLFTGLKKSQNNVHFEIKIILRWE